MTKEKNGYQDIAKSTWIFGSSQVIVLVLNIVRTKFIAVFLGTEGYGLISLFTNSINLIGTVTGFGLGTSAIKEIAQSNKDGDAKKIAKTVSLTHKIVWLTGIFGTILTITFSPILSFAVFGNYSFTISFIWLGISVLFNQLTIGNTILLRGLRLNRKLANANMTGALFGLLLSIPLYYFFGTKAIVPTILLSSIISYLRSLYFTKEIKYEKVNFTFKNSIIESKSTLILGLVLSLTSILTILQALIIRIFIEKKGGVAEVGLYHAGFVLINTYLGVVFTIMSNDYYPSLAEKFKDKKASFELVNKQLIFGLTLLTPLICGYFVLNEYIIIALFSKKFILITMMIAWSLLGTFFKLISWTQSYMILSDGNNKRFMLNEVISIVFTLSISILSYEYWGLNGLGISYLIGYVYYTLQTHYLCRRWYGFHFNSTSKISILLHLSLASGCFYFIYFTDDLMHLIGILFLILSIALSYYEIKKMGLTPKFKQLILRKS
ncbi:MAG: oligosaccharide flippase family protein [Crocinitomicaceae bacterium]|nr:oligosaccharide flippase family protein [Crocinitomicaceae bacterium]MCF8444035.1 oligosaccharide flippase family protein [Crocinitomicaceae bacterium]